MSRANRPRLSPTRILARVLIIASSLALTALMVFHQQVPDVLGLGLVVDNLAPWLGLGVVLLFLLSLAAGGRGTFLMLLVPALAWSLSFGGQVLPATQRVPVQPLTVATQNVHGQHEVDAALTLARSGAAVIALQEMGPGRDVEVARALDASHPHYYSVGTVGVWSSYPLSDAQPLDLGLEWSRALRLDVRTDSGSVRFYTVHAASARPTGHADRDMMLANLAEYLARDPSGSIVVAGDFNATATDRHFGPLAGQLDRVAYSGWGLALTWPRAPFPVLGIDHVLTRGVQHASLQRVEAGESDHLALLAELDLAAETS